MRFPPADLSHLNPGYVYLVKLLGQWNSVEYKIGQTKCLERRMGTLAYQVCACPIIIAYGYSPNSLYTERQIQNYFDDDCIGGERFSFHNNQIPHVISVFKKYCEYVETDCNRPVCPNCGCKLKNNGSHRRYECPDCQFIFSFDRYFSRPDRLLPYVCDAFHNDDEREAFKRYMDNHYWGLGE